MGLNPHYPTAFRRQRNATKRVDVIEHLHSKHEAKFKPQYHQEKKKKNLKRNEAKVV
jgi:hypothetical protein